MPKYNANKIPYNHQELLIDRFCTMLAELGEKSAIKYFLKDLLNRQERIMLIRRLLVAKMLLDGYTYDEIQNKLKVGKGTIAKVSRWLYFGRGGYKKAISKFNAGKI